MSEIDWSKAPADATHANGAGMFLRLEKDGSVSNFDGGQWVPGAPGIFAFAPDYIFTRPIEPWTGEGLPPVGAHLEATFACEQFKIWHEGVCVAVGTCPEGRDDMCVVQFGEKIAMYTPYGGKMRPIKTPEQIAAEKRKAAIDEMINTVGIEDPKTGHYIMMGCLHDAGYRKP